jgi:hypothetical protein
LSTAAILDLALDKKAAAVPTRRVPWDRYAEVLNGHKLAVPEDPDVRTTMLTAPMKFENNANNQVARTG